VNASVLKRTLAIAAAVAVPWYGWSVWSARREAAAKEALAAEIRSEMAARRQAPDPTAGRMDLTAEYADVLKGLNSDSACAAEGFLLAMNSEEPWTSVPPAVSAALTAHAENLRLLDSLVDGSPPGCFEMVGSDWNPWSRLSALVRARGLAQAAAGDWAGLRRTVRTFRRVADDFLASARPSNPIIPAVYASTWWRNADRLLESAAVHPALPGDAAAEALALATGTSFEDRAQERIDDHIRQETDNFCLELLGDDPQGALRRSGLLDDDPFLKRTERLFEHRGRRGRVAGPPSAAALREMRALAERYRQARERKDGRAISAGGDLDREARRDLGGGWTAAHLRSNPVGARVRWLEAARLPVLRAALALRVHESRTGSLPATLSDLVPSILDAVPVDPWTGEPVHYARKPGGGWILEAGPPTGTIVHYDGVTEETKRHRLEK